jgi:hypothetical protein
MRSPLTFVAALALVGCAAPAHPLREAVPSGTLYLAGVRPSTLIVVHVRSSRARTYRLRGLGPGDPPYMLATTGGRLVTFTLGRAFSYGPGFKEPPRSLGHAWFFVPSARPGRVWLALLDDPRTVTLRGLREVTVKGRVTVAHTARPPGWPLAALDTGLVIQRRTLELWNPSTGAIVRSLPGVFPLAAHGSLLASCSDACPALHVTDTRSGTDLRMRPSRAFRFSASYDGAFSTDGHLLAVPAKLRHGGGYRVALVDLERRRARLLRGAPLDRGYPLFSWARSGWLFFNTGHGRIAAYRPGASRATLLPVRVPAFTDMAAP